jgi:DNA-binding HxlR family transcriptional regulator
VTEPRDYRQGCGVAKALDLLGERWTMLIVRELLLGPKRFGHLQDALPGLGPTLLAKRLKALTERDLIEQTELPPPAAVTAYVLTRRGERLRPVLEELAIWGFELLDPARILDDQDMARGSWLAFTSAAAGAGARRTEGAAVAQFDIDGDRFSIRLRDGRAWVRHGVADDPDATLTASMTEWWATVGQGAEPARVDGDRDA